MPVAIINPPSFSRPLQLPLSPSELDRVNAYLHTLPPQQILEWALDHLPNLYQTTAFGLTGLVILDMLSKITPNPPPLIFLDTLYHFPETLELVRDVEMFYRRNVHVYKPENCADSNDFEAQHGQRLWETDESNYDYLVKVGSPHLHSNLYSYISGVFKGRTCPPSLFRA